MKRLFAFILIIALCLCLAGCKSDGAPAGMKLASDTSLVSYSLYVPENWVIDNSDTTTRAHVSSVDTSSVSVGKYLMAGEITSIDSWWNSYKLAHLAVEGFEVVEEGASEMVDGKGAKSYTYKTTILEIPYKHYATAVEHDGSVYVILYTAVEGTLYDTTIGVVKNDILANMKFN